jgi:hypothetical protein
MHVRRGIVMGQDKRNEAHSREVKIHRLVRLLTKVTSNNTAQGMMQLYTISSFFPAITYTFY